MNVEIRRKRESERGWSVCVEERESFWKLDGSWILASLSDDAALCW